MMGYNIDKIFTKNSIYFEYLPSGNLYDFIHIKRKKLKNKL